MQVCDVAFIKLPGLGIAIAGLALLAQRCVGEDAATLLAGMKLMNYYAAHHAQSKFWSEWDGATVDQDMARVRSLNANTLRLAVFVPEFEFPKPSDQQVDRLKQTVSMADQHGLRTKLSLFAFFSKYDDIAGSVEWAQAVLGPFKDDPRIAYIDLQNEIDPAKPAVMPWALQLIPKIREIAGNIPIGLSLAGGRDLSKLRLLTQLVAQAKTDAGAEPDLYEIHFYGKPELAYATFVEAKKIAAPKPVFVGEAGYSTDASKRQIKDSKWQEAVQDQYFRAVEFAAKSAGFPPAAPWIFQDFAPGAFPATKTGGDPGEYHYGLLRVDGSAKPAAETIKKVFAGQPISLSFNNGFESVDDSGNPIEWSRWKPNNATFALDRTIRHSGTNSVRIEHSKADPSGEPAFYVCPVKFIAPSHSYHATTWAKGSHVTGTNRLSLAWFDAQGKFISKSSSNPLSGDTAWTQLSVSALSPPSAAYVEIHLSSAGNAGAVWFDDVTFD